MMENSIQKEWLSVSQHDLNEVETKEQRGIKLEFMFSPADLPVAWRVVTASPTIHVVEFKYLSDSEPKRAERQEKGITLEVGKNSRRIYKIIMDFSKLPPSGEVVVKYAAESVSHAHGLNRNNSEIIHRFLSSEQSKPEILEKLRD